MSRFDNLKIREFTQALLNFIDGSDLPEEVKRMALQEVLTRQEQKARDNTLCLLKDAERVICPPIEV